MKHLNTVPRQPLHTQGVRTPAASPLHPHLTYGASKANIGTTSMKTKSVSKEKKSSSWTDAFPKATSQPADAAFDNMQIGMDARTLGANVTNAVRNAIISGKLAPGQALGQEHLASLFGVSRVPIRECLKQLASEGLIEVEPHKGAIVAHLSVAELDELYGILWSLETMAVRVGISKLTDANIAAMAEIDLRLQSIDDPVEWYRNSVALHQLIVAASGWERCYRIIAECRRNIGRYFTDQRFFMANVAEWRKRNRVLFKACKARDVEAAVKALDVMRQFSTAQVRTHLEQLIVDRSIQVGRGKPG
jgi:DNA-binding GntR family transcriptional regulator